MNCQVHFESYQLPAIDEPEAGAPPLLLRQLGRPGKGLTLILRLVPHPGEPRHLWAGPTKEPEAGAPPLLATATEGRPGKELTLTLRLVPHPGVPRHLWAGPTKEPEAGAPPLFATATEGRPGKGLTHTLRPIPVQTHLGRLSNGFDNSRQPAPLSPCRCTTSIKMNWHPI